MRGHIARRGRGWGFVIDLPSIDDKRRQRWFSGYSTKRDAQRGLVEVLGRVNDRTVVEPARATTASYLAEWLDGMRARLRPSTWESYRMNIQRHITPHLGDVPLQNLTADAINSTYGQLHEKGRVDGKGGLSPRSIRYVHVILHHALRDAVRRNRVPRNVADLADPPRSAPGHEKIRVWDLEQAQAFLAHVAEDRYVAAWVLALTTGMRRGELLGLRWSDVDLELARISVQQTLTAVHGKLATSSPKTPRSRRAMALDPSTSTALQLHRHRQLEEQLALGIRPEHNLVFTREDGSPVHPDRFSKWFDAHARAAGLPRIRFHDVRHTAATLMLAEGTHAKIVSERLGHASIAITLDTYSHVLPSLQAEVAVKMGRALFGI
jgi:integrase